VVSIETFCCHFCDSMLFFWVEQICAGFLSLVYICIAVDPTTLLCLSHARAWIYNGICRGLYCVPRVKMRDVCTLRWYWWSCWPSLFTFSFHNESIWSHLQFLRAHTLSDVYFTFKILFTSVDNYIFPWRSCAVHLDIY
jgi:hypothetical protein